MSTAQINSGLDKQKETDKKILLSQQSEWSGARDHIKSFEGEVVKQLSALETTVKTFVDHDIKKVLQYLHRTYRVLWEGFVVLNLYSKSVNS